MRLRAPQPRQRSLNASPARAADGFGKSGALHLPQRAAGESLAAAATRLAAPQAAQRTMVVSSGRFTVWRSSWPGDWIGCGSA
jgi:hypothetical protein